MLDGLVSSHTLLANCDIRADRKVEFRKSLELNSQSLVKAITKVSIILSILHGMNKSEPNAGII
jgi:hypothetical protein